MIFNEKMKKEALIRLQMITSIEEVIENFKNKGDKYLFIHFDDVFKSIEYNINFNANLDSEYQELLKNINEFEETYYCFVYAVLSDANSDMFSLFFVDEYTAEWNEQKEGLKNKTPFVYVMHKDGINNPYSVFGTIVIKESDTGASYQIY